MKIETYKDVLEKAKALRLATPPNYEGAEALLRAGIKSHPYALPLGDELVTVMVKQGKTDDALKLLEQMKDLFKDSGKETLCRFGKIYKDKATAAAEANIASAIPMLIEAESYYLKAYEKSYHYYPRINQLTTRYLRAGCLAALNRKTEAENIVQQIKTEAQNMLQDISMWEEHEPDDAIWIPATQGEAYILLGNWNQAAICYELALSKVAGLNYSAYMIPQIELLMEANKRLSIASEGKLADLNTFFNVTK